MKQLLLILGFISLVLGIAGIFLPILPTTPFLLLTSYLFFRSSEKMYNWLMNHHKFGPYIKDFMVNKAIPLKAKVFSVSMLWASLVCCAVFIADFWVWRIAFILIAIAVTIHILSYKTK